jgi:hypothetical protein
MSNPRHLTTRSSSASIGPMIRLASGVVVASTLFSCSKRASPPDVLATVKLEACSVGDLDIFGVDVADELVRISRTTGEVQRISNDFRSSERLLALGNSAYMLDVDGVHIWANGGTARKTLAETSASTATHIETLVRFGQRVCWGVDLGDHHHVDCYEPASAQTETWAVLPVAQGLTVALAASDDHMFVGMRTGGLDASCGVYDISRKTAEQVGHTNGECGALTATRHGPLMLIGDDPLGPTKDAGRGRGKLVALTGTLSIAVPASVEAIATIANTTYVIGSEGIASVDLTHGGEQRRVVTGEHGVCGDERDLFVFDHQGLVRVLPSQKTE